MDGNSHIRLASYNMRKCIGLDRRRKPGRIIDVLNSLQADVVALQEADRRLGERHAALPARMIEDETDFRSVEIENSGPSLGWHGNAVLVRKELSSSGADRFYLPGTEPRGAVRVQVSGFQIVATHLGLLRSDRRSQLTAIRQQLKGSPTPTVIVGDFNEWAQTRGLEPISEEFTIHSPGRSFHAARPIVALDRVAVGRDIELLNAGVGETATARIASDHLPIWADIKIAV